MPHEESSTRRRLPLRSCRSGTFLLDHTPSTGIRTPKGRTPSAPRQAVGRYVRPRERTQRFETIRVPTTTSGQGCLFEPTGAAEPPRLWDMREEKRGNLNAAFSAGWRPRHRPGTAQRGQPTALPVAASRVCCAKNLHPVSGHFRFMGPFSFVSFSYFLLSTSNGVN
jgi:hypothetical protein